jgi:CcmD family protein
MHKIISTLGLMGLLLFVNLSVWAQEKMTDEPVQMADGLRSSGKIYVVVAVVITILAGLFAYLINLDKKISRLEKK